MRTIIDSIRMLRDTADMLMDRSERERQRGNQDKSLLDASDATAYRRAADYLATEARRKGETA